MSKHLYVYLLPSLLLCGGIIPHTWAQSATQPSLSLDPPAAPEPPTTLTNDWFGYGEKLRQHGVTLAVDVVQTYQGAIKDGRVAGDSSSLLRYGGMYDLEVEFDLEKMLALPGAKIHTQFAGSWGDAIASDAFGTIDNISGGNLGSHAILVKQLFYEQSLLDDHIRLSIGQMDLTGGFYVCSCPTTFDSNSYANNDHTQFMYGSLGNNPTIPLPDPGLAAAASWQVLNWWYVAAAAADGRSRTGHAGFNTTFDHDARLVALGETGFTPALPSPNGDLPGAYRVGLWYDTNPADRLDGTGSRSQDVGYYLSCDQMLYKANSKAEDKQGLGVFARFGWSNPQIHQIHYFWSTGLQYQGLIPGRGNDTLGFGVAQSILSADAQLTSTAETVLEAYYNIALTPYLKLTPDVQYICHPGGGGDASNLDSGTGNVWVIGARLQLLF